VFTYALISDTHSERRKKENVFYKCVLEFNSAPISEFFKDSFKKSLCWNDCSVSLCCKKVEGWRFETSSKVDEI